MTGRLTSFDEARNAYGVSYRDLYQASVVGCDRLAAAMRAALEAWDEYDRAIRAGTDPRSAGMVALRKKARELARRAVS